MTTITTQLEDPIVEAGRLENIVFNRLRRELPDGHAFHGLRTAHQDFLEQARTENVYRQAVALERFCRVMGSLHGAEKYGADIGELWRACAQMYTLAGASYQAGKCRENADTAETIGRPVDVGGANELLDHVDSMIESTSTYESVVQSTKGAIRHLNGLEKLFRSKDWTSLSEQELMDWSRLIVQARIDGVALRYASLQPSVIDSGDDLRLVWLVRTRFLNRAQWNPQSILSQLKTTNPSPGSFNDRIGPALREIDSSLSTDLDSIFPVVSEARRRILELLQEGKPDALTRAKLVKDIGISDETAGIVLDSFGPRLKIGPQSYLVTREGLTLEDPTLRANVTGVLDLIEEGSMVQLSTAKLAFDLLGDRRFSTLVRTPNDAISWVMHQFDGFGDEEVKHHVPSDARTCIAVLENLLRISKSQKFGKSTQEAADRILELILRKTPSIVLESGLDGRDKFDLARLLGQQYGDSTAEAILDSLMTKNLEDTISAPQAQKRKLDVLTKYKNQAIGLKYGVVSELRQSLDKPAETYETERKRTAKEELLLPMIRMESTLASYVKEATPIRGILGFTVLAITTMIMYLVFSDPSWFLVGFSALVLPVISGLSNLRRWFWLSPEVHGQKILLGATSALIFTNALRASGGNLPTAVIGTGGLVSSFTFTVVYFTVFAFVMGNGIELVLRGLRQFLASRDDPSAVVERTQILSSHWSVLYASTRGAILVAGLLLASDPTSSTISSYAVFSLLAIFVPLAIATVVLRRYLGDDVKDQEKKETDRLREGLRMKPIEAYVRGLLRQKAQPIAVGEVVQSLDDETVDQRRVRRVFKRLERAGFGKTVKGQMGRTIFVRESG